MAIAFLLASSKADPYPAWTAIGPWGGAARTIRLDSQQPATMLATSMRGTGVFRSRDGASNWTALRSFPELPNARLDTALIIRAPASRWLVGAAPGGLWRSLDEGDTWTQVPGTAKLSVFALAAWPKDEHVLAAGTDQGVWLSHDAGDTWRRISPQTNVDLSAIVSVAFDPAKASTIYAGTPHLPWKTLNAGNTWTKAHSGMFDDSDIFSIAVDPTRPGRIFASACSGIYCSLNSGLAWRRVQGIPGTNRRTYVVAQSPHLPDLLFAGTSAGMWTSTDGGFVWKKLNDFVATSIAFHPTEKATFYISTERHGLAATRDQGEHFELVNQGFVSRNLVAVVGDESHLYAVARYEGSAGGVYRKISPDSEWETVNTGKNFDRFAVRDGRLLARDEEGSWLESHDQARSWTAASVPVEQAAGDWFETRSSPFAPNIQLRASREGMSKSQDSGRTWRKIENGLGSDWIGSITFHPKQKGLCFALRGQRVFWSLDDGEIWYWLPTQEPADIVFQSIHVAPAFPSLLFAVSGSRGIFVVKLPETPL